MSNSSSGGAPLDSSMLPADQRIELEDRIDNFEQALRECRDNLPDVTPFVEGLSGESRLYVEHQIEKILGDQVRGKYVKVRRIGGGGMGDVFLVRHLGLERHFAMKEIKRECLHSENREEFESRFRREVRAHGRLQMHPNLVSVTDAGTTDDGIPFLVMEFVDGSDLTQVIKRHTRLPISQACQVIHDAAVGLAYAHTENIVHRDIKPSNLMISKHGTTKVLDLGLARELDSARSTTFVSMPGLVGTFDYMSPEQCREETEIGASADVYSLGCTLYHLLSGKPPFAGAKSIYEKLEAHQSSQIPRIDFLVKDHTRLWKILAKMMAKDIKKRFDDLDIVAAELEEFTVGSNLRAISSSDRIEVSQSDMTEVQIPNDTTPSVAPLRRIPSKRKSKVSRRVFLGTATAALAAGWLGPVVFPNRDREITNFIATLPGLNGRWWFEEMPWLLPDVRLALIESLTSEWRSGPFDELVSLSNADDVPAFYVKLKTITGKYRHKWSDVANETAAHFAAFQNLDPEKVTKEKVTNALEGITDPLVPVSPDQLTATQWHLLAIRHHFNGDFNDADTCYDTARLEYGKNNQQAMWSLCSSDWGHMLLKHRKNDAASVKFELSRTKLLDTLGEEDNPTELFKLDSLCNEADSHRKSKNWSPAIQSLQDSRTLAEKRSENHPLRAKYYERCAWYHLDVWQLAAAEQDFNLALAIRKDNGDNNNHRAKSFEFWDEQGLGMVKLYKDEISEAFKKFDSLIKQINKGGKFVGEQAEELEDRLSNLYVRRADALLFERNDSREASQKTGPIVSMDRSIERALKTFRKDGRGSVLVRLMYKRAIISAVLNGPTKVSQGYFEVANTEKSAFKHQDTSQTAGSAYLISEKLAGICQSFDKSDSAFQEKLAQHLINQNDLRFLRKVSRDDRLLLLFVGTEVLTKNDSMSMSSEHRKTIAEQVLKLAKPPANESTIHEAYPQQVGPPKLFQRLADLAKQYTTGEASEKLRET